MPRPYSQVAGALQDLGNSITGGFDRMSRAKTSAADYALRSAQQAHDIEKEKFLFPELKQRRDNAVRANAEQAELDKPLTVDHQMNRTFGDETKDYEVEHYFANDVPGTFLKSANMTFNPDSKTYHHADGRVVSKREFEELAPLYQNVILSKTDYVKRANDELNLAISNKDNARVVELKKLLDDPSKQFHLGTYDAQEKALLDQKARLAQLPPGTVDLTHIDDSINRIRRKRDETLSELDFQRKLKIAGARTGAGKEKGLKDKEIGDWRMKFKEQVDAKYEGILAEGGLTIPVMKNEAGQYLSPNGMPLENLSPEQMELLEHTGDIFGKTTEIPMTDQQIEAMKRSEVNQLLIEQLAAVGYVEKSDGVRTSVEAAGDTGKVQSNVFRTSTEKAGLVDGVDTTAPAREPKIDEEDIPVSLKEREAGPDAPGFKKIRNQAKSRREAKKQSKNEKRIAELEKMIKEEANPVRRQMAEAELETLLNNLYPKAK